MVNGGRKNLGVDDGAPVDRGKAEVGLERSADEMCEGVNVVETVGVELHERQHAVGALAVLQPYARGLIEARIGLMNAQRRGGERQSGTLPARTAPVELLLDDRPVVYSHSLTEG